MEDDRFRSKDAASGSCRCSIELLMLIRALMCTSLLTVVTTLLQYSLSGVHVDLKCNKSRRTRSKGPKLKLRMRIAAWTSSRTGRNRPSFMAPRHQAVIKQICPLIQTLSSQNNVPLCQILLEFYSNFPSIQFKACQRHVSQY